MAVTNEICHALSLLILKPVSGIYQSSALTWLKRRKSDFSARILNFLLTRQVPSTRFHAIGILFFLNLFMSLKILLKFNIYRSLSVISKLIESLAPCNLKERSLSLNKWIFGAWALVYFLNFWYVKYKIKLHKTFRANEINNNRYKTDNKTYMHHMTSMSSNVLDCIVITHQTFWAVQWLLIYWQWLLIMRLTAVLSFEVWWFLLILSVKQTGFRPAHRKIKNVFQTVRNFVSFPFVWVYFFRYLKSTTKLLIIVVWRHIHLLGTSRLFASFSMWLGFYYIFHICPEMAVNWMVSLLYFGRSRYLRQYEPSFWW